MTRQDLLCTSNGKSSNLLTQFFFGTMTFSFDLGTALSQDFFPLRLGTSGSFINDLGFTFVSLLNDFSSLQLGFFQLIGGVGLGQIQIFLGTFGRRETVSNSFLTGFDGSNQRRPYVLHAKHYEEEKSNCLAEEGGVDIHSRCPL